MEYEPTEKQKHSFRLLTDAVWGVLNQYTEVTGKTVSGEVMAFPRYGDFVLKAPLPIIRIPRTVITIQPPYSAENIQVHNKRFEALGRQLKREVALFWAFGKKYAHKTDEELNREYPASIFVALLVEVIEGEVDLKGLTQEEKQERFAARAKRVALERARQHFEEFISSKN